MMAVGAAALRARPRQGRQALGLDPRHGRQGKQDRQPGLGRARRVKASEGGGFAEDDGGEARQGKQDR